MRFSGSEWPFAAEGGLNEHDDVEGGVGEPGEDIPLVTSVPRYGLVLATFQM
jgi:hypothetical protein